VYGEGRGNNLEVWEQINPPPEAKGSLGGGSLFFFGPMGAIAPPQPSWLR